jgi:4-hydroxybenzoate polyprenyltransferase
MESRWDWEPVVLAAAVMFWVAGFDIIYATLDADFDRKAGIHSLVQKLGIPMALLAARVFHAIFVGLLVVFGRLTGMGMIYVVGVIMIAFFLIYEHALVDPGDLRRVNAAFFTLNGVISVFFLLVVALSVFLR